MFITGHTSVAIFLGLKITNPVVAFVIGVLSHFVFDMIPHGDRKIIKSKHDKERRLPRAINSHERNKFLAIAALDGLFTLVLLGVVGSQLPIWNDVVLLAIFGAALPDALQGVSAFTKIRLLDGFTRFHHKIHYLIPWDFGIGIGLTYQILASAFFLWLSFGLPG